MSSYNIKCLFAYIFYCILCYLFDGGSWVENDSQNAVINYILIPLVSYLLLPFILKLIERWKVIIWLDKLIDSIYRTIKSKF